MIRVTKLLVAATLVFSGAFALSPRPLPPFCHLRYFVPSSELDLDLHMKEAQLALKNLDLLIEEVQLALENNGKEKDTVANPGSRTSKEEANMAKFSDCDNTSLVPRNVPDSGGSRSVVILVGPLLESFTIARSDLESHFPNSIFVREIKLKLELNPFEAVILPERDATYFSFVLDYLKYGDVDLPSEIFRDFFLNELKSLGIPINYESIEEQMDPRTMSRAAVAVGARMKAFEERFIKGDLAESLEEAKAELKAATHRFSLLTGAVEKAQAKLKAAKLALSVAKEVFFSTQKLSVKRRCSWHEKKYLDEYLKYFGLKIASFRYEDSIFGFGRKVIELEHTTD